MDAVIVRMVDLPAGVKGMTVMDEEGDYNIYINGKYSPEMQVKAFEHEVRHIKKGHFQRGGNVRELEAEV